MSKEDIPSCEIYIDKNGRWFYRGAEMVHREIVLEFYRNMTRDCYGNHIISFRNERCRVEVEDAPLVVKRVVYEEPERGEDSRFVIFLNDDTRENLAPETLFTGDDNVMYCEARQASLRARFDRAAYYQLAEYLKEKGDMYYLPFNGNDYLIAQRR